MEVIKLAPRLTVSETDEVCRRLNGMVAAGETRKNALKLLIIERPEAFNAKAVMEILDDTDMEEVLAEPIFKENVARLREAEQQQT
jgi:ParB-like chromosome segregation protein Spo0J